MIAQAARNQAECGMVCTEYFDPSCTMVQWDSVKSVCYYFIGNPNLNPTPYCNQIPNPSIPFQGGFMAVYSRKCQEPGQITLFDGKSTCVECPANTFSLGSGYSCSDISVVHTISRTTNSYDMSSAIWAPISNARNETQCSIYCALSQNCNFYVYQSVPNQSFNGCYVWSSASSLPAVQSLQGSWKGAILRPSSCPANQFLDFGSNGCQPCPGSTHSPAGSYSSSSCH